MRIVVYLVFGLLILGLTYTGGLLIDNRLDKMECKSEFKERINETYYDLDCYANENFDELFDKELLCSCFYETGEVGPWGFKTNSEYFIIEGDQE